MAKNILEALINVSEKAANIARSFRQDKHLFELLVQEKNPDESNPRFVHDYKTLADVLIQEVIRHDIGSAFPDLKPNIKGEENSIFTNPVTGETARIQVSDDPTLTTECLLQLLGDCDPDSVQLLTDEAHRDVRDVLPDIPDLPDEGFNFANMGIWVDPIDATDEYIKGITITNYPNIPASGLGCVTVLIGAYDIESGKPIIGIINQPFYDQDEEGGYRSKIVWGVNMDVIKVTNLPAANPKATKLAVLSPSEDEKYIKALRDLGYGIVFSAGAGHKILKVVTGDADLYLLSKNTTFKWDTCGPHAILNAIEGGLFKIDDIIESGQVVELDYDDERPARNDGGLLALRHDEKHILQNLYNKK